MADRPRCPGVSAAGVDLGGLSAPEAAARLQSSWTLLLSNGEQQFPVDPALLGITLDAQATAQQAVTYGRGHGDMLRALIGGADVPPVIQIDLSATEQGLQSLRDQVEQAPVNAGIQLVNGTIQPRPATAGKSLDIDATLASLRQNAAGVLADGVLELAMIPVLPQISDSSALVQAAGALLATPLQIHAYDPIDNSDRRLGSRAADVDQLAGRGQQTAWHSTLLRCKPISPSSRAICPPETASSSTKGVAAAQDCDCPQQHDTPSARLSQRPPARRPSGRVDHRHRLGLRHSLSLGAGRPIPASIP